MTELNSALAASLDKLLQKESSVRKESSTRMFLRDAAMTRMTYILKNSTEKIGVIGLNYNIPKQLESDMTQEERLIIKQWATGISSGRYAMVAFLDCRRQHKKSNQTSKPSDSRPIGLMTSSINFPLEYLSSESQMYEECFGRPPAGVLRDALQMLTKKSMEDSPMSLRPEQIDLAWRQMKIERLNTRVELTPSKAEADATPKYVSSDVFVGDIENSAPNVAAGVDSSGSVGVDSRRKSSMEMNINPAESYSMVVLEIMMEMVRMFHAGELSSVTKAENTWIDDNINTSTSIDVKDVEEHLDMPLQQVMEEAKKLSSDELDASNIRLKNYVQNLSHLKADLVKQLEEVQDTAMYATLGITSDTSEAQIKKAYHSLAIKLHPDRKGGDKEKFQLLQSAYQEILKKRRIDGSAGHIDDEMAAMDVTETAHAQQLMMELAELLGTVKVAAEQCAMLAQLCIQGQKMMETAAKEESSLDAINALLTDNTSLGRISQQVIEPLETGCEFMQSIASKAMALPGIGSKFANAAAIVGGFTRTVEKCMSSGLESLRSVTEVMSADLQLSVCRQKISRMIIDSSADHSSESLLIEAAVKSFRTVCTAMCAAADKSVRAAEVCAELIDLVAVVVSRAESEAVADRRRQAEKAEKDEYREGAEADSPTKEAPKEEEPKEPEATDEEGGDVVENLMKKVKQLQLQLRVQNVQTLQSLNATAVEMQTKLHDQLSRIDLRAGLASGAFESHLDSILTLIAEVIDGCCNGLHLECEGGSISDEFDFADAIDRHLGWMRLKARLKIALLPDLRSRTLWFAALADIASLKNIIMGELPGRLCDCVRRAHVRCGWAVVSTDESTFSGAPTKYVQGKKVNLIPQVAETAGKFCADIMLAVQSSFPASSA